MSQAIQKARKKKQREEWAAEEKLLPIRELLTEEEQNAVTKRLKQKGARECPRCKYPAFFVSRLPLTFPATSTPAVVTYCKNCGYLMAHALGVLGLLRDQSSVKGWWNESEHTEG